MPPLARSFSREAPVTQGDGSDRRILSPRIPPDPADVEINVEGAFIVDEQSTPSSEARYGTAEEGVYFENKDIRLPHHTAVVSHVAVDVRVSLSLI